MWMGKLDWAPWIGSVDLSQSYQISVGLVHLSLVSCWFDWKLAYLRCFCWNGSFICYELSPLPANYTVMSHWWSIPWVRTEGQKTRLNLHTIPFAVFFWQKWVTRPACLGKYTLPLSCPGRRGCEELWLFFNVSHRVWWSLEDVSR